MRRMLPLIGGYMPKPKNEPPLPDYFNATSVGDQKAGVKLKVAVKNGRCMLTICRPDCTRRSANFGPKSDVVTACGCAATPV